MTASDGSAWLFPTRPSFSRGVYGALRKMIGLNYVQKLRYVGYFPVAELIRKSRMSRGQRDIRVIPVANLYEHVQRESWVVCWPLFPARLIQNLAFARRSEAFSNAPRSSRRPLRPQPSCPPGSPPQCRRSPAPTRRWSARGQPAGTRRGALQKARSQTPGS